MKRLKGLLLGALLSLTVLSGAFMMTPKNEAKRAEAATVEQLYQVDNSMFNQMINSSSYNPEFSAYAFKYGSSFFGNTPRNQRLDSYLTFTPDMKKVTSVSVYVDFRAGGSTYSSSVIGDHINNVSYTLTVGSSTVKSGYNLGADGTISFTHSFSTATDQKIKINFHDDENSSALSTYYYNFKFTVNGYYCSNVTFNKQSGTGGANSVVAENGNAMPSITVPTRTDYKFLGYFDAASGGNKYYNANGTSAKAWNKKDKSVTLYAQWELDVKEVSIAKGTGLKNVYIASKNSITSSSSSDLKASGTKFNVGSTVYAYAQLAKGYKAKSGWTLKSGTANSENALYLVGSATVGTSGYSFGTISADIYNYGITYSGLSGATVSGNPSTYNINTSSFTLNNPTKTGYTFTGWSGTDISGKSTSVTVSNGSIGAKSYTANWVANDYDVAFDSTYGEGGLSNATFTYDSSLPDLNAEEIPFRESSGGHSYSFAGYYTEMPTLNDDGSLTPHGKQYYDKNGKGTGPWKEANNSTTLYAYWTIDMTVESASWIGNWESEAENPDLGVKRGISVTPIYPEGTTVYYGTAAGNCNNTNADDFLHSDAGTYEIYFEVRKDGYTTYYGSETITINKASSIIDPRPSAKTDLEYTASDQELIVAGEVDYGDMLYAVSENNEIPAESEFHEEVPTGKLVGTYYVFYKSSGDSNHNPHAVVATEVISVDISRVDRTEIENLNAVVLTYLATISQNYPDIAATLEAVRSEVYQDAIVEDNITVEGVNENIIKLQEALSAAKVDVTETLIGAIGTVTYPNSKDAVYAAKDYYDNVLNENEKADVDATLLNTLNKDVKDYEDATEVADLINAIPEPSETPAYYDAVDAAKAAYDALAVSNPDAASLVNSATDRDYEVILENNVEAKEVIELIEAIGNLTYKGGTNDSLADIEEAEEAYAALLASNPDAAALVDVANYETLLEDRESYDEVDAAVELINNIGSITHGGETDSKEALDAAREAYDALSEEEKALVAGYESSYKTLDDSEHVYEALVLIDEIGDVDYDSDSQEKINKAREFYDSLSEDQKTQLGEKPLTLLQDAENDYATLKKNGDIWLIVFLTVSILLLIAGIVVLFLLLRKRNEDDNGNDGEKPEGKIEPVKAMSFAGLPLIILTSHYLDTPYLILYAIAGLTILVWLIDLVVAIYKSYRKAHPKQMANNVQMEETPLTETEETKVEESETKSRRHKTFVERLENSPEATKKYYEILKKEATSYKGVTSRVGNDHDTIVLGRGQAIRFGLKGKTLCAYYHLDVDEVDRNKYKVEVALSAKYAALPCMYRVENDKKCERAKELIALVMRRFGIEKGEEEREELQTPPLEETIIPETEAASFEDNADGDEVTISQDENGNTIEIRYVKSFTAKLSQADETLKDYYNSLKNYVLSYKGVNSKVSWHYDSVVLGKERVLKFAIRGKTLCAYYPLDPKKVPQKYKVEEAKGKKYEEVPCLYRIKNERRCQYAKDLFDRLMKKRKIQKGEELNDEYRIPREETQSLIAKGLIKEVRKRR